MKKLQYILAAGLICGASALTACSDDSSSSTPSTNNDKNVTFSSLKGKWINIEEDGQTIPTNMRGVITFESEKNGYFSTSFGDEAWLDHVPFEYKMNGDTLSWVVQESEFVQVSLQHVVQSIDASNINTTTIAKMTANGQVVKVLGPMSIHFIRLEKDYTTDILGLWEGKSTSEKSEFDDGETHRWEYKGDGTYIYYNFVDGEWEASETNKYFMDGTLLCTRWKDGDTENREWWEVESIKDNVMKWTAYRIDESGKPYTATFEMTKASSK